jgi:hypothetical protein
MHRPSRTAASATAAALLRSAIIMFAAQLRPKDHRGGVAGLHTKGEGAQALLPHDSTIATPGDVGQRRRLDVAGLPRVASEKSPDAMNRKARAQVAILVGAAVGGSVRSTRAELRQSARHSGHPLSRVGVARQSRLISASERGPQSLVPKKVFEP